MNIINTIQSIDRKPLKDIYKQYCKDRLGYYFGEEWFVDIGMKIKMFLLSVKDDIVSTDNFLEQIDLLYNEYDIFKITHLFGSEINQITDAEMEWRLKLITKFLNDNVRNVEYITDATKVRYHRFWNGYDLLAQAYKIALRQAYNAIAEWIEHKQKPLQRPPKRAVSKNSSVANKKEKRSQGGDKTYDKQEATGTI